MVQSFWIVFVAILAVAVMVLGSSFDMKRYKHLEEPDTCPDLQFEATCSLSVFGKDLDLFFKAKDGKYYHNRFTLKKDPGTNAIFHVDFGYRTHIAEYSTNSNAELFNDYINKYRTILYFPLDTSRVFFLFEGKQREDVMLTFYRKKVSGHPIGIGQKGTIIEGSVPLLQYDERVDSGQSQPQLAVSVINNRNFSYETGILTLDPLNFAAHNILYFAFNQNMSTIYFAETEQQLIDYAPDYYRTSKVVPNKWHPFRCYDYVYIYLHEWTLIFPYLNVTKLLSEHSDKLSTEKEIRIYYTSMSVMHRNSFFRCSSKNKSTVTAPEYPVQTYSLLIVEIPTEPLSTKAWLIVVMILLLIGVGLAVAIVVIRKKKQQLQLKKDSLLKHSKSKSKIATTSTITASTTTRSSMNDTKTSKIGKISSSIGKSSIRSTKSTNQTAKSAVKGK